MAIDFTPERWKKIREDFCLWWSGELDRPLIQITLDGRNPGRPEPELPNYEFTSFYDLSIPAEAIVDRWDYNLSCRQFLGDAFPCLWPNFGAGVMAAFLGAGLENREETVWFHPKKDREIADIDFEYDPNNVWLKRVKDICRAAIDRWQGLVQVGMTDLGGNLDILSSFRPGEKLLLDLYDHPEEVKRLTWDAHELWFRYFREINSILQPVNPGHTAWTPIFSDEPYYMLQCDFCYMIGPEMFDEFVKPELIATCNRMVNPFYHLDGPGQLAHLDSLLEIQDLKGVQWIPGAGSPPQSEWPEVYAKIRQAGKLIQLHDCQALSTIADQFGSAKGIVLISNMPIDREEEAVELLERYGAD